MLLHKGCEKRLGAHLAKLDTMISDLATIGDKADEKIANASKAWNKSAAGVKFAKDAENVEWLRNQYADLRKKIVSEMRSATGPVAEAQPEPEPKKDDGPRTHRSWGLPKPTKAAEQPDEW